MAKKEVNTDLWVHGLLNEAGINLTAQGCDILEIDEALKTASKSGTGNVGYPEFCGVVKDFLIVIEDKATLDKQLKGQKIGVCSGYTGQFYAKGDAEWGFKKIEGATVNIYENISLAITDLKAGNINAIIMDDSVAKEAVAANADAVKLIDTALTVEEYGIAIDKTNKKLKKEVDKALNELVKDGTVDKLLEKYDLK